MCIKQAEYIQKMFVKSNKCFTYVNICTYPWYLHKIVLIIYDNVHFLYKENRKKNLEKRTSCTFNKICTYNNYTVYIDTLILYTVGFLFTENHWKRTKTYCIHVKTTIFPRLKSGRRMKLLVKKQVW